MAVISIELAIQQANDQCVYKAVHDVYIQLRYIVSYDVMLNTVAKR